MKNKRLKHLIILIILSCVFFILGNNIFSITNPDEVFYVQTAKEMVQDKSWLTPYYLFDKPQFEKPIFIYLILRLEFILFGFSKFAVRLFPSLFGMAGVIAVYFLSLIGFGDERKAFISSLVLASSFLYIGLSRIVLTDMVFSVFILFSLLSFLWGYLKGQKAGGIILFSVFSALAVLTKGALGCILPFLVIITFLLARRDIKYLFCVYSLWGLLCFVFISFPWYIFMINQYGSNFTQEFFNNIHIRYFLEAEHDNDTWYFYPLSVVICMFPWCVFVLFALKHLLGNIIRGSAIRVFIFCWIAAIFCVFQLAHTKLVSYLLPIFPALSLVIGDYIQECVAQREKVKSLFIALIASGILVFIFALALSLLFLSAPSAVIPKEYFYFVIIFSLFFCAILTILIFKAKPIKAVYLLSLVSPALIFWLFFIHKYIWPYTSAEKACDVLMNNYVINNTILCSKDFAVEVRYYTGADIAAVYIIKDKDFINHHPVPVPFFNSYAEVKVFLSGQQVTYCVLDKTSARDVMSMAGEEFEIKALDTVGNKYILMVKKKDAHL